MSENLCSPYFAAWRSQVCEKSKRNLSQVATGLQPGCIPDPSGGGDFWPGGKLVRVREVNLPPAQVCAACCLGVQAAAWWRTTRASCLGRRLAARRTSSALGRAWRRSTPCTCSGVFGASGWILAARTTRPGGTWQARTGCCSCRSSSRAQGGGLGSGSGSSSSSSRGVTAAAASAGWLQMAAAAAGAAAAGTTAEGRLAAVGKRLAPSTQPSTQPCGCAAVGLCRTAGLKCHASLHSDLSQAIWLVQSWFILLNCGWGHCLGVLALNPTTCRTYVNL
ncbi:hypothetical protein COO60DRAFT_45477 [Scenedesmus sp. NREL 46B-D3]|nr:hypothetical protein COO60DRAFT_45477 [Scenedesmus sp. NREL 46B-D3]